MIALLKLHAYFFPLNVHALVPFTMALMVGIAWQAHYCSTGMLVVCFATVVVGLIITHGACRYAIIQVIIFCFIAGIGGYRFAQQQKQFEYWYTVLHGTTVDIIGTVHDIQPLGQGRFKQQITLAVECIKQNDRWQSVDLIMYLQVVQTMAIDYYDKVLLPRIAFRLPSPGDYRTYLIKEGVLTTLFAQNPPLFVLEHASSVSVSKYLAALRNRLHSALRKKLSPETFSLFSTIFLGNRHKADHHLEEHQDLFRKWGISHHLARSGLHLVLVGMIFKKILTFLPLTFIIKQFVLIGILLWYVLLSWSSISLYRALGMFLLYKLCDFLLLPTNVLHLLTLVCFFTLLHNPHQLFFLDFQLSFCLTFALAWLNHYHAQQKIPFLQ